MQKKELQAMDWCQLSEMIMNLEVQVEQASFATESEFVKAVKLLDLLESEKWERVQDKYDHGRRMSQMYQDSLSQVSEDSF